MEQSDRVHLIDRRISRVHHHRKENDVEEEHGRHVRQYIESRIVYHRDEHVQLYDEAQRLGHEDDEDGGRVEGVEFVSALAEDVERLLHRSQLGVDALRRPAKRWREHQVDFIILPSPPPLPPARPCERG